MPEAAAPKRAIPSSLSFAWRGVADLDRLLAWAARAGADMVVIGDMASHARGLGSRRSLAVAEDIPECGVSVAFGEVWRIVSGAPVVGDVLRAVGEATGIAAAGWQINRMAWREALGPDGANILRRVASGGEERVFAAFCLLDRDQRMLAFAFFPTDGAGGADD
jgi:hypothetical protein